jgi:hypothetical protein
MSFDAQAWANRQTLQSETHPPTKPKPAPSLPKIMPPRPSQPISGSEFQKTQPERRPNEGAQASLGPPRPRREFPAPIPSSALKIEEAESPWFWEGFLAPGAITLLYALWKVGKSTLIGHLLRAMDQESEFCGLATTPCRVIYVTEESEAIWAERCRKLGIGDWCRWQIRPFVYRPNFADWHTLLNHLSQILREKPADLVIFDPLTGLWPVRDENNASDVQEALQPLRHLGPPGLAILLVHHLRKGDGAEATGARGSGATCSFADILVELRRYAPGDRGDRRRVLSGYGRWSSIPAELVIELNDNETEFRACGTRREVCERDLTPVIQAILPSEPPGLTIVEIRKSWDGLAPRNQTLRAILAQGAGSGAWRREGPGRRGAPFTFWRPPTAEPSE